ncbi:Gfo/Idh/MocA family oxidoreductase [Rhodococcus sp. IEGM 1381]|uniref:Gfo/Idh/MocA family protein n=1 Tax=Rhodococcus sp. IEGM 1381 TaxID=3047085 RepID=UPI0024B6E033|nr:Gfo/Idh/MocA family oxidoreductase [Rhodococcus sp. IEGM 1381]MDI9897183.1 Gfo/Idh/MocA family oxidoreductase [Rhodococcus sp. IEGM 1381]
MSVLRIGILGASRIAEHALVEPARILGHRLVACAARDRTRAENFAERFGVERVLDSYQDVVDDPEVDVVYNPLANALHAPWNLASIRAGKPVLTEKPSARTAFEADEVRRAASEAEVPVMEGFHYLFHPVTERLQQLASDGTLGDVLRIETITHMPAPAEGDPRWSPELSGGAMMDLGCYGLHAQRLFGTTVGGDPSITAARLTPHPSGVDAAFEVDLTFPTGATGSVIGSMTAPEYDFRIKIIGCRGEALAHNFIKPNEDDRVTTIVNGDRTTEHLGTRSSYTYQLEAFANHVLHGGSVPLDTDDAVQNMQMIDRVLEIASRTDIRRTR